jgi:large subunit ribosomal protein L13
MTTTHIPTGAELERHWFVIDAKDIVLGKLATEAANILSGKNKAIFTPFLDTGDHVIVINADKVHLTGRKETGKIYRHHTGFLGGLKSRSVQDTRKARPTKVVEEAIRGMLPKTKLGRAMFHKLKVYAGNTHPHEAQKPKVVKIEQRKGQE